MTKFYAAKAGCPAERDRISIPEQLDDMVGLSNGTRRFEKRWPALG
jgi:hypothetical protein